jgi:site-specific recombinase XerD
VLRWVCGVSAVVSHGGMTETSAEPREWLLTWARSGIQPPGMFHPVADDYADIERFEREFDIPVGTPVLIDPDGGCDIALSEFFRSPHFNRLRPSSKKSYALDLRLWVEYLDSRAKNWREADPDDVSRFWLWRSRSDLNPNSVGGSKANRELAAITLLYRWASHPRRGHVPFNPIERETLHLRDGSAIDSRVVRSTNVVRERVRWLTPRTFRLWRDVGIDGYTAGGLRDEAFRGRTALRNKAMVELLYGSGLRVQEAGSLLITEVPPPGPAGAFNEAHLPASIAKGGRSRTFYVLDDAVALVNSYNATSRRAAVERARKAGRYEDVLTVEVTDMQVTTASVKFRYHDAWHHHDNIEIDVRKSMFINTEDGREPLWLWLNEAGLPMLKDTWTDVFGAANDRVAATFDRARRAGMIHRNVRAPRLSPHSLRHSFALFMLIALHRSIDARLGTDRTVDYDEERYRMAWEIVRDLLGHKSVTVTRERYLAPLNGVRLQSLVDGPDLQRALHGLSMLDSRVVDVEVKR